MVLFNKNIYKYANEAHKNFYLSLINKYYYKPNIELTSIEGDKANSIKVTSIAEKNFYFHMKDIQTLGDYDYQPKTEKTEKIENINSINNFINTVKNNYCETFMTFRFANKFECEEKLLAAIKSINQITKYFYIPNEILLLGVEYINDNNEIDNLIVRITLDSISNNNFVPLFDLDDGFINPLDTKKLYPNNVYIYLDIKFNEWKKRNYEGEILD
jgi:hypothetical protein